MPRTAKSIAALRRELKEKQQQVGKLKSQRDRMSKRLAALDRRIAALAGAAPARKGKPRAAAKKRKAAKAPRPGRRGRPLAGYIRQVLGKAPKGMRAKDVEKAVRKAGYKTASKDFYGQVSAALRESGEFKRLARGVYALA